MSTAKNYSKIHEQFVISSTGSSAWECLLLVSPYPFLAFFSCYFANFIFKWRSGFLNFLMEFIVLVVPLLMSLTLLHKHIHIFIITLIFSVIICLTSCLWNRHDNFITILFTLVSPAKSRPYLTYFRSIINLVSVFCILAVDFHLFPRKFAKTETYGFGLMDTGVGFYIVANGVVAKHATREGIFKTMKNTFPIIVIGIIRCISVKTLEYPQIISEYGTHWNFFFTLAVVKLASPCIRNVAPNRELLGSVVIAVTHQCILAAGVESWILSDSPRDNPLSANREGICSLLGFLSLYLAAVSLGKVLNTNSVDLRHDLTLAGKGFFTSLFLYIVLFFLNNIYPVSRRLANITYVVWMLSMTVLLLTICIIIEISLRVICFVKSNNTNDKLVPTILNSINYNGLLFFLLGNLFTGLINIWFQTMYINLYDNFIILTIYMFSLCCIASILFKNNIKFVL